MSENVLFAALFFPALAVMVVFTMKYLSAVLQARARMAQDEGYKVLAAAATAAQAETAYAVAALNATLVQVNARMAALEKILKEVE